MNDEQNTFGTNHTIYIIICIYTAQKFTDNATTNYNTYWNISNVRMMGCVFAWICTISVNCLLTSAFNVLSNGPQWGFLIIYNNTYVKLTYATLSLAYCCSKSMFLASYDIVSFHSPRYA